MSTDGSTYGTSVVDDLLKLERDLPIELMSKFRNGDLVLQEPLQPWPQQAVEVVLGPRQRAYATPIINILRMSMRWTEQLHAFGIQGTCHPRMVCLMMKDLKMTREENSFGEDNYVDSDGYGFLVQRIDYHMKQLGFNEGIRWFDGKQYEDLAWLLRNLTVG